MLDRSDLHDYQHEIVRLICAHKRCAIWAFMGTGKTCATLTALSDLSLVEDVFPALVVAPLRVARHTWPKEAREWRHLRHLRVVAVTGTAKERQAALDTPADIYTINYDNLPWLRDTLGNMWPFKTVIADEFTRLKSFRLRQGGSRARALGQVAHTWVDRFIGLTGTPAPNGVKDLWGCTWFLDKGERLGKTFSAFEQRWFRRGYDGYSLVPYDHSQAEIQDKLSDICFTIRGLPVDDVIEVPVWVELPPKVRKMYDGMEAEMFAELRTMTGGQIAVEAVNNGSKINKLRQIANGFIFDEDGVGHELHDEKIKALESVIEEANGANMIVAYTYVPDKERLLKHFRTAVDMAKNADAEDRWNEGKIDMLVAHAASAGHGLSLQHGGNMLADFGIDWNLEHDAQIIERIGPMRQKQSGYDRPVFRYRIMARNTVEEWGVLPSLQGKASVQDLLLAAMERKR